MFCGERISVAFSRRKKLKSTSMYIYQTLFLNGENSDIKICALGEEWNLHKVYLRQSGYFSSMFSGSWKESGMDTIELEIPDQNIDIEALQVAFGSLYRDDVLIKPGRVVALLAAACMLQLDGLILQCGETMKETITAKTVCGYYSSAGTYGLDSVKKSLNLMKQLISSSNLFVMQVEMDLYTALKKWMFLQLVPSWNGPLKQLLAQADAWFAARRRELEGSTAFLDTEQGAAFRPVFAHLRLQYIVSDLVSARIIERDALIPSGECVCPQPPPPTAALGAGPGGEPTPGRLCCASRASLGARCPGRGAAFGGVIARCRYRYRQTDKE
ncbi:hypothetical protein ASZ78_006185 [Callipepla squamata]|uniref:BTB domain-containing protein n=1 Tax=Callipepla squamata TaxID=9009 RepID=A0A226N2U6_CALSU|nr:hypothetical protein ASZ78_006185 [Callipepla squamata]